MWALVIVKPHPLRGCVLYLIQIVPRELREPFGWKAPVAGGSPSAMLNNAQQILDTEARQVISRELGHERLLITAVYLGR